MALHLVDRRPRPGLDDIIGFAIEGCAGDLGAYVPARVRGRVPVVLPTPRSKTD